MLVVVEVDHGDAERHRRNGHEVIPAAGAAVLLDQHPQQLGVLRQLGVGYVEIEERMPDRDWDVVLLRFSDSQLSQNPELLRVLIQQYGRTCRRYDFVTITPVPFRISVVDFNDDQQTLVASL